MRRAFLAIPKELEEAALMEGCRWWQVLFRVLLPMSRPSVLAFATVSITYHWNEYLWPLMMLNDPDKQVLTVGWSPSPWAPNPAASGAPSAPGR